MRAIIAAKLEGQGLTPETAPEVKQSNVIDLMAALKKSLGQVDEPPLPKPRKAAVKPVGKAAASKPARKQA